MGCTATARVRHNLTPNAHCMLTLVEFGGAKVPRGQALQFGELPDELVPIGQGRHSLALPLE